MFRKILIAFAFFLLLAGVSYVKTLQDYAQEDAVYDKAKSDVESENKTDVNRFENSIDSLGTVLLANKESFESTLTDKSDAYETQLDSLENIIDKQSAKITTLNKAVSKKTTTVAKKKKKPTQLSQHEKIYRYYKKRYTNLPGDLSTYEQKIALSEIREETASKFSISLKELSRIRKEYKLNY